VWKVLTHLGTPLDTRGEPKSRIRARKRLPTHMRVDGRTTLTKCAMKSNSKMDQPRTALQSLHDLRHRPTAFRHQFDLRVILEYRQHACSWRDDCPDGCRAGETGNSKTIGVVALPLLTRSRIQQLEAV
jgi:hypothetical protein